MYFDRAIEKFILSASKQFSVILITGPRQVGKTSVLKFLSSKDRKYVTLDDPRLAELAKNDPEVFLEKFSPPVLIDEIQYAPELLPFIKIYVDKHKKKNDFWITGSEQFQLMKGVTESLAGRVGIIRMLGLSQFEINKMAEESVPFIPTNHNLKKREAMIQERQGLLELYKTIWRGSFPELIANKNIDKDFFYSSYLQTYLERDVRQIVDINKKSNFLKFLRAVAARTGCLLNVADLARDANVNPVTAQSWLNILETSGLIYLLEPYYNNLTSRMVKTPKLYFLDTGLCSYLTDWSSHKTLESGAMSGQILESFIFAEILKSFWHNGQKAPLYYYRDKDKKEIDLLIIQDGKIYPLEFKKSANPDNSIINRFSLLEKFGKEIASGGVICLSKMLIPINKNHNLIPVNIL